jgi:hypothetical protein
VTADFTPKPGQNILRDVTTDTITGKPHKVKVCGPWLQFDEDAPIQLPEPGMHVRMMSADGYKEALVRGHDSDHIYHVDPRAGVASAVQDFGKIMGDYPAAFGPDGEIHIQRDSLRPDFAAEGIHHIAPDGRWVMNNDPALNRTIRPAMSDLPDVELIQCDVSGHWVVGKCDALTNSGIARFNMRTGELEHFGQYSQMPPFTNEQGWVAIQGSEWKMTPEPDAVPWIRHEDLPATPGPIVTPPVVPPPPAPADCTAERERIAALTREVTRLERDNASLWQDNDSLNERLGLMTADRDDAVAGRLTPDQVIKLVNDATGQMAGYWRYLGVQGAVDRVVKAELARRK